MKNRKPIETEEQFVKSLEEFLCDVSEESLETVEDELREIGYDPNELGTRMRAIAEQALASSPLNWRSQAHQKIMEARDKLMGRVIPEEIDRAEILSAIQQQIKKLGYGKENLLPTHSRNFEKASDKDLLSLLYDLEHLTAAPDDNSEEA